MNWIPTKTKLPDTTRTVLVSDGKVIGMANFSKFLKSRTADCGWVNCTGILPGVENWLYADEIILWAEVEDLHKTLPAVQP